MNPQRPAMFPPPWWIALDLVATVMFALGLVARFEPASPAIAWLPAGLGTALLVAGAVLLLLCIVLLLRLLMDRARQGRP